MIPLTAAAGGGAPAYLPYVIGVIVAVFGGGGLAALLKSRPEGSKIIVDAAAGAVVVQSGVIDDLNGQLEDARKQIRELQSHLSELSELRAKNAALERRVLELESPHA